MELKKDKNSPIYKFFEDPGNYQPPEGGESLHDVCKRTKEFMEEIIEPQKDKLSNVLIAGHGAMIRNNVSVLNHPIKEYWRWQVLQKNCGTIIVKLVKRVMKK